MQHQIVQEASRDSQRTTMVKLPNDATSRPSFQTITLNFNVKFTVKDLDSKFKHVAHGNGIINNNNVNLCYVCERYLDYNVTLKDHEHVDEFCSKHANSAGL